MDQKQKVFLLIIPIVIFLSIVMNEMNLWNSINRQNLWAMAKILIPIAKLLALYGCLRLYRAFANPFFKIEGITLALSLAAAGLRLVGEVVNTLYLIIGLTSTLLALYALLQYREGWEQSQTLSPIKRLYELIPVAKTDWFWLLIFGLPLGLYRLQWTNLFSASLTEIIYFILFVVGLSAQMLGLLTCLAMVKDYRNNFFKFLVAVYIIPLGVAALSFFYAFLGLFLNRFLGSRLSVYFNYSQITFNYILAFHEVVVASLLVYAFFTYREPQKRERLMWSGP